MRFRLAAKPPLRPLKAWFDISNDGSVLDILGVKAQICLRLPQLVDAEGARISSAEMGLFIDDFELLDDSTMDIIKENDLVHIAAKQHGPKRKAANDNEPSRKKQRIRHEHERKKRKSPVLSASSGTSEDESSDSSTTSSSESSASSSSSTSSSETSSASSSSSSSSSAVEVQSSKLPPPAKTFVSKTEKNLTERHTRPGQGKVATHNRNARRRVKRFYEKARKLEEQPSKQALASSSANAIALGTRKDDVAKTQTVVPIDLQGLPITPPDEQGSSIEIENMVSTLRNKNKKKGFRKSMAGITPQKITFTDDTIAPPASTSTFYSAASTTTPGTPRAFAPRLVRPSEKQAQGLLPSNMFVTSVEVETETWDKRKKSKQRNYYDYGIEEDDLMATETVAGDNDTKLNYGEPEIDWVKIDRNWVKIADVSDPSSLKVGTVIGWKALAINPATFSPETLVHLGRIKEIKHDSSSIVLEPIRRPGSDEIAFGAVTITDESENTEADAVEDETYTFEDALKTPWKLVDI